LRRPSLSVIIPALNEVENIGETIESVGGAVDVEVIVVDGGSSDGTREAARSRGARVISSARGRGAQMNGGARVARGEVLLFLHADTRLPPGFDRYARETLARAGVAAGAFRLHIMGDLTGLSFLEKTANLRSRFLQFPYGDQAIFLKRDLFGQMGGFPDIPIMEDFELVRRLHRRGRVVTVPVAVATSARRWERLGVVRATLINYAIVLLYYLGVSPSRLTRWFRPPEGSSLFLI